MKISILSILILFSIKMASGSTIVGLDTFKIGDKWIYHHYVSDLCCTHNSINGIHKYITDELDTVQIIDRHLNTANLSYVIKFSRSTLTYTQDTSTDSIKSDSTFTDTSLIGETTGLPYGAILGGNLYETHETICYKGDTLILENGVGGGSYTYLQKVGYLEQCFFFGFVLSGEFKTDCIELISFNDIPIDTSKFQPVGNISHLNKRATPTSFSFKLNPTHLLLSISSKIPLTFSIYNVNGKLVESGQITNSNVYYFKKILQPGFYVVRFANSSFDYSHPTVLCK